MDNSSIRGRFSLSTTNLTSPIAESTCLNGLSSRSKFNWGEGTISPRSRNNSTTPREKDSSMSKNLNGIPAKVSMSPSSRIDPRTYVDIHSNGLASRIVKYHDNSARLNRSLSMTNLYNKPGQFPVVHLKKSEQQYKAKKTKNLSMTRIAAPEKSAFHGNTLSSILRSGSIVGLQKSDEEISRENRPILHPPPTENEMAPTRSVLEVLKEISRKRINSDEMNGTELTKKQCKESEQDPISNISQRTQSKRQREINNSTASNAQISPEQQVVKKRMCNYNNDIMSSLSSSMTSVNKNKMIEVQSQKRTASDVRALSASNTCTTDFENLRSEKQRCMGNFDLQHFTASTKHSPITPLPSTPHQSVNELDAGKRNGILSRRASEPVLSNTKPKLTLFNKDYDELPTNVNNDIIERREDGDLCGIQFVKPKKSSSMSSSGSLLMEKTKKSKLALMLSGLKGELDEKDEVDTGIHKEKKQRPVEAPVIVPISIAANITSSTNLLSTTKSVATSPPTEKTKSVSKDSAIKPTEVSKGLNLTPTIVTTNSSTIGSLINTAPVLVTNPASAAAVPAITKSAPVSSIAKASTPKPAAVGFSFGLSTPTKIPPTTTAALTLQSSTAPQTPTSTSTTTISVPSLTGATKPLAFGSITTERSASTAPSFTFDATTTLSQTMSSTREPLMAIAFETTTTKTTESAPPVFGQSSSAAQPTFSFGSLAGGNSTANALTTASPATTSTLTTNFGSENAWNPSATSAPKNTIVGIGSFGGSVSSSLPQSTSALTSTTLTGGFSFGSPSSTEAPKALFGSMTTANTTSTNSNTTFSFSANKAPTNPMAPVNAFTFGAGSAPSSAAPVNTAITFGTTAVAPAPMTSLNPQNMFGNTATTQPPNTFSFGSSGPSTTPQKGAFSFSSSDKTAIAAPTTGSSVGGFSFNNPSTNSLPALDASKNIFGAAAPAAAEIKPAFNFGSTVTINQTTDKPPMFSGPANIFGTPATASTPQGSAFTFVSSSSDTTNQGPTASSGNPFGPGPPSNIVSAGSNSIFGAPSAAVAPLQQSSTFSFGASSTNTKQSTANPSGGFIFGSSSSIGSNASKPAVDMNKTFVFGDGNTTIKPAPSSTTNLFGRSNATNGGGSIAGATDNKMFSFGAAPGVSNNTFVAGRQTLNPAPAFNFGAVVPAATAPPAPNGNLFVPQGQPPTDRPIRKAMRRLHKT